MCFDLSVIAKDTLREGQGVPSASQKSPALIGNTEEEFDGWKEIGRIVSLIDGPYLFDKHAEITFST